MNFDMTYWFYAENYQHSGQVYEAWYCLFSLTRDHQKVCENKSDQMLTNFDILLHIRTIHVQKILNPGTKTNFVVY
jgi:hypothetical protein